MQKTKTLSLSLSYALLFHLHVHIFLFSIWSCDIYHHITNASRMQALYVININSTIILYEMHRIKWEFFSSSIYSSTIRISAWNFTSIFIIIQESQKYRHKQIISCDRDIFAMISYAELCAHFT